MLVDSHCHLNFADFKEDLDIMLKRAKEEFGVRYFQNICTKISEFDSILEIANLDDVIYCSVGVHPNEAEKQPPVTAELLIEKAKNPKVIGLGETGLDYYYEYSDRNLQKKSFIEHIKAAQEIGLPLIIHTREADQDIIDILKSEMKNKPFKGLIHCFTASKELADECLSIGLYISISGIITFKNAQNLREIVREIPADRLLVETDAPYLAPVPHRGKRNEPGFTRYVADFVADLKGVSKEEFASITTNNFFTLFDKAKRS